MTNIGSGPAPNMAMNLARDGRPNWMDRIEEHKSWPLLSRLPMRLTADIPLRGFRVRDLLGLRNGVVLQSEWMSTDDVPLKIGEVQIGWIEFEVVDQRMAVRLTRLA